MMPFCIIIWEDRTSQSIKSITSAWCIHQKHHNMMQTRSVTTSRAHGLINFSVENAEFSWQLQVPGHMPQFRLQSHTKPKRKRVKSKNRKTWSATKKQKINFFFWKHIFLIFTCFLRIDLKNNGINMKNNWK